MVKKYIYVFDILWIVQNVNKKFIINKQIIKIPNTYNDPAHCANHCMNEIMNKTLPLFQI